MSAIVDDKYWHPDPKMSVIMELKDKVISLEAENARLQKAVDEKELFELRSKEVGKSRIELYREIFDLVDYIKHIAGISNTSVQHYWPDTCETCKEIRKAMAKNELRINRLLSLFDSDETEDK